MGPLEAARELADGPGGDHCYQCGAYIGPLEYGDHMPDCPWLAMPQIVAALEAARELVNESPLHTDGVIWTCGFCHGEQPDTPMTDDEPFPHDAQCPWQAVAVALTGYPA